MNDRDIGLAKVGLRALIDEATGYQQERSTDDLRRYAEQVGVGDLAAIIDERISLAAAAPAGDEA